MPGGDRWHILFDTETKHFCVVHEWGTVDSRPELNNNGVLSGGAVELDIASFLATRKEGPAQRKLQRLIKTMFENQPRNMFED